MLSQNKIFISWIIIAILFFIIGRQTASKISKIEKTSKSTSTMTQSTQISTQAKTKKDSNLSLQMNYVEKYYNNKGKLIHEIDYGNKMAKVAGLSSYSTQYDDSKVSTTLKNESNTITSYQPNWGIGISVPIKAEIPSSFNVIPSYRLISNLYVIGNFNVQIQPMNINTQIGLMLLL